MINLIQNTGFDCRLWGYRLNRLEEPIFMAVSKPLLTEFGIHHRLESCALYLLPPQGWCVQGVGIGW